MAMDLHGILNQNEYYTNHYFTTIFEENASDTIANWRQAAKDNEGVTPWAAFRDTSKNYYRIREKYMQLRNEDGSRELIESQATEYIAALGYCEPDSINIELNEEITVPVFHEEKKPNGAPLLWVLLSVAEERDDDILKGKVFGKKDSEDEEYSMLLSDNNDDVLAKLFFAGAEAPRWIILIGINQIALIDRNKWDKKKYLQFDLEEIFSRHEETTFQALSVLLHKESLCPVEGNSLLDSLDENSYKHSSSVSDSLKYALRECIELLGNEVLYDMRTRQQIDFSENPVDAGELTLECLRYMYRVLFMLFIEAREELGFAPMKSDVYQKGYSLEGVRDVCENVREMSAEAEDGYYIDETISALFDMIYTGYPEEPEAYKEALKIQSPHDMFTIEPLKAHIFDPQYTKLINAAKLRNVTMLKIVDLMSISRPSNAKERRGRISYSALGINQMGAVYEALLSYRGFIADEDLYEVKRAGDKFNELDVGYFVPECELDKYTEEERVRYEDYERRGKLRMYEKGTFIYRLAGREREKSASYYTPEVLTKCLVKYALKELLKDKKADDILNMTVCEPAMGSAAFLNEAISQLAEAYLDKKQEELGKPIAFDQRTAELQRVKMYIADRNVYGVDLNPIAVELAEVSLWLNTIYKGAHVPWFGTQLACGNSLIGARRQVYNALKLKKGTWYNEEPEKVQEEWETARHGETHKVYKRKRSGGSYIYHFLIGDPGMANYTDKVIKELEPDNIKLMKQRVKDFCEKYSDDDIEVLNKLSELVDDLWMRTIFARQKVEIKTEDSLSVFGHDEGEYKEHLTIREKDAIYQNIYKSIGGDNASPYARLKAAMDYWCALWFWPIDKADLFPSRQEFFMELSLILEGGINATIKKKTHVGQMELLMDEKGQFAGFGVQGSELANEVQAQIDGLGVVNLEQIRELYPRLQIADDISKQQRFMHWELEFADLFYERGGFDLVIGNPPWINITWEIQNVVGDFYPRVIVKNYSATDSSKALMNEFIHDNKLKKALLNEYEITSATQSFSNAISNYSLLKGMQTDLYKCFISRSMGLAENNGIIGFVHPESIFNDPKGEQIRKVLLNKLVYHFHFLNELTLFAEVDHHMEYGLNVYSNTNSDSFDAIFNLFSTSTIDDCYIKDDVNSELGIKTSDGKWNTNADRRRIIHVGRDEIEVFAKVFDGHSTIGPRLPALQTSDLVKVVSKLSECKSTFGDLNEDIATSGMWHETNDQKNGNITLSDIIPLSDFDMICTGPNIGICNPAAKASRVVCEKNSDYDCIDLEKISDSGLYRTKYQPGCSAGEYQNNMVRCFNNNLWYSDYRIVSRMMLNLSGERSLISAIIPPKRGHVNGLMGFRFKDKKQMVFICGLWGSLVFDFFVRIMKKQNFNLDTASKLPIGNIKYMNAIILRTLCLNSVGRGFDQLISECYVPDWEHDNWAIKNDLLARKLYSKEEILVKNEYLRRELLLEIDVLSAMSLGLSLDELIQIYKIQFPVLQAYDNDTWYDRYGRIVFTVNRGLVGVGLSRSEWDEVKNKKQGIVLHKVFDNDGMFGEPAERTIEYVAPFNRCDREKDYKEVWASFEERFNK